MPKTSAGMLAFRRAGKLEVFLVHPGGPFYQKKDLGTWTIPKGEFTVEEDALSAAKREFFEETGVQPDGQVMKLTPFKQKGGKEVHAWAMEMDFDAAQITSNTFEMEWPPRSGKTKAFPEVDRGEWFGTEEALSKILDSQKVVILELLEMLK